MLTEKPAEELNLEDKKKILANFFLANIDHMIKPYHRFYELYIKYKVYLKNESPEKQAESFSATDYRDLQVLYNLGWIGMESGGKNCF